MDIIDQINAEQMEKDLPDFSPGDTVVVSVKVKEGNRERLQAFEGIVIAKKNRGLNSAFTVRSARWAAGTDDDPHVIELDAAPDNVGPSEELPLAPWS